MKLYHGTSCERAEQIARKGFKPTGANVMMPSRWWTLASDRASAIDHSDGCLVEFDLKLKAPPKRRWKGWPFLWNAKDDVVWCADGKQSRWYAVREHIPAAMVKRVTKVSRPGCR